MKEVWVCTENRADLCYSQMRSHLQGKKLGYSCDIAVEMRWDKKMGVLA